MLLKYKKFRIQTRALPSGNNVRIMFAYYLQKMGQNMANVFFVKQGWLFSGMFLIFLVIVLRDFSDDGPKWAMLFYGYMVPIKT